MKRLVLYLVCLFLACSANAQYYVYQTTGEVSVQHEGIWRDAYVTQKLDPSDLVRTGDRSCLVVLDRKAEKVYSFQVVSPRSVDELVRAQSSKAKSLGSEVCQGIFDSMFGRNEKSMAAYKTVSGVTYRGEEAERAIAAALAAGQQSSKMVSFRLVDMDSDATLTKVKSGEMAVVEVTNHTDKPLYFNIIDIDSNGAMSPVMPFDEYQTMLHLFVPPHSVVRFSAYPVEFYEPLGRDQLILVAHSEPFNLANVLDLWPQMSPAKSDDVILHRSEVRVY